MKRRQLEKETEEYNHVYVNLEATNNTNEDKICQFEMKGIRLFQDDASIYSVSVNRLSMDGVSIPILNMPDDTKYEVRVQIGVKVGTAFVKYVKLDGRNPFNFGVYSYRHLCDMISDALFRATETMDVSVTGTIPSFRFYSDKFALFIPDRFNDPLRPESDGIYFNQALYSLFENFYVRKQSNGWAQFITDPTDVTTKNFGSGGINVAVPDGYSVSSTEYQAFNRLMSTHSVVIKTSSLATKPEFISNINTTNNLSGDINNSGNIPKSNMLTDLVLSVDSGDTGGVRGHIYYAPSRSRFIDIIGRDVTDIDCAIFLKDRQGIEIPFYIAPGSVVTLKLQFIRKDHLSNI